MGMKEEEQESMLITESASLIKVAGSYSFSKKNITWMKTDSCDMAACLSFCHSMPRGFANLSRCKHLKSPDDTVILMQGLISV